MWVEGWKVEHGANLHGTDTPFSLSLFLHLLSCLILSTFFYSLHRFLVFIYAAFSLISCISQQCFYLWLAAVMRLHRSPVQILIRVWGRVCVGVCACVFGQAHHMFGCRPSFQHVNWVNDSYVSGYTHTCINPSTSICVRTFKHMMKV